MHFSFLKKLCSFIVLALLFCIPLFSPTSLFAEEFTVEQIKEKIGAPQTKIKIPGVNFSEVTVEDDGPYTYINIPFLGEYIAAVYKYAIAVAAVVAVVMIIVQGLRWTISGGESGKIEEAKKGIGKALIGLLLAVGSYTMLYTINPYLVEFQNLRIRYIPEKEFLEETQARADSATATGVTIPGIAGKAPPTIDTDTSKYKSPFAGNSWCSIKNPSTNKSTLPGVDFTYFGSLDCLKADQRRPASQIQHIVLHDGLRYKSKKPTWLNGFEKKYNKTIVHPSVYLQFDFWRSEKLKTGFGASSHYTIARDGTIYQSVDDLYVTYHAPGQNKLSIGVDLIYNTTGSRYTNEQYEALAKLVKHLAQQYPGIQKLDDSTVYGHGDCNFNRVDPYTFDFERLNQYIPGNGFKNEAHPRIHKRGTDFAIFCDYIYEKSGGIKKGPASSS